MTASSSPAPLRRWSAGFSLIELMIAMTIGLILLTVLATVFSQSTAGRNALERITRLTENSRFAADVIGDDIRHAGFYGNFMPPTNATYLDPSPCDWDVIDVTRLGWDLNLPVPCYPAQLLGDDLDPENEQDAGCFASAALSNPGLVPAGGGPAGSPCADTEWHISSRAADARTGAAITLNQGVTMRTARVGHDTVCE